MKKSSLLIIFYFIIVSTYCQKGKESPRLVGDEHTLKLLGKETLIVLVLQKEEGILKDLSGNKKALDYYDRMIEGYNESMREAATDIWRYEMPVEFKTLEEINQLKKSESAEKYLVTYSLHTTGMVNGWSHYYQPPINAKTIAALAQIEMDGENWYRHYNANLSTHHDRYYSVYHVSVEFAPLEDFVLNADKNDRSYTQYALAFEIHPMALDRKSIDKVALAYALIYFREVKANPERSRMEFYKENASAINSFTVILLEEYEDKLDEITNALEEMSGSSEFKIELTDKNGLNEMIQNGQSNYAYAAPMSYRGGAFFLVIINSETNEIITIIEKP